MHLIRIVEFLSSLSHVCVTAVSFSSVFFPQIPLIFCCCIIHFSFLFSGTKRVGFVVYQKCGFRPVLGLFNTTLQRLGCEWSKDRGGDK